jgi:hypothetical protein
MRSQGSATTWRGPDAFPTTRSSSELEQSVKFHRILQRGPDLRTKVGGEKQRASVGDARMYSWGWGRTMIAATEREPESENEDELTVLVRRWIASPQPDGVDRTCNEAATSSVTNERPPTSLPTRRSQLIEPCGHSELTRVGRHLSEAAEVPVGLAQEPLEVPQALQSSPEPTQRLALLVDARATPPEAADGLTEVLAGMGSVTVRRGYADWTRPDMGVWLGVLRRHGIQPVHHFSDEGVEWDDEQALVSMSVDAVDLARNSAVDAVVIVGNPGSMVPLVTRLHGSGVRVVTVGPESTPDGVRASSDDFIDFAALTVQPTESTRAGRHRA